MVSNENGETDLTRLYRDVILTHSSSPVGYQLEIEPTHSNEQYNPQCGDRICLHFRVENDEIQAVAFDGAACAICMASASLLCSAAEGLKTQELLSRKQQLETALNTGVATNIDESLDALMAVKRFPSRIKCALLPWEAADAAMKTG